MCTDSSVQNSAMTAALPAATSATNNLAWEWRQGDSTSTPVAGAISSSYTITNLAANTGNTDVVENFYVRYFMDETRSKRGCYSPFHLVSRTTHPRPLPQINTSIKPDYCWNDPAREVTLGGKDTRGITGSGSFTVSVNNIPSATTDKITLDGTTADKTVNLLYTFTTNKGCKVGVTGTVRVHHVPAPALVQTATQVDGYKVLGFGLPRQVEVSPRPAGSANTVAWYRLENVSYNRNTSFFSTSAAINDPATEPAQNTSKIITNTYYAKSVETVSASLTCYSDTTGASFVYRPCQALAPRVDDIPVCVYDNVPAFKTTRTSNNNHTFNYLIFSSNPGTPPYKATPVDSIESNEEFTPGNISTPFSAQSTGLGFWFAENDITDQCQGNASLASIKPKIADSLRGNAFPFQCQGLFASKDLAVVNPRTGASIFWYDSTASIAAQDSNTYLHRGNSFTFSTTGQEFAPGTYRVKVAQAYLVPGTGTNNDKGKECLSPRVTYQFTIRPRPARPDLTDTWTCEGSKGTLSANMVNDKVLWFEKATDTANIARAAYTGSSWSLQPATTGRNTYYALNISNVYLCVGFTDTAIFDYRKQPDKPVITAPFKEACTYELTIPAFSLSNQHPGGVVTWTQNATQTTANTYTPVITTTTGAEMLAGTYTFSATQTVDECVSPAGTASFKINPRPTAFVKNPSTWFCYNSPAETFRSSSATTKWYSTNQDAISRQNVLYQSSNFTPKLSDLDTTGTGSPGGLPTQNKFFATSTDASTGCESFPVAVIATINPKPLTPVVQNDINLVCHDFTDTTTIDSLVARDIPGATYHWYSVGSTASLAPLADTYYHVFRENPRGDKRFRTADTSIIYAMNITDHNGCPSDTVRASYLLSPALPALALRSGGKPFCIELAKSALQEVTPGYTSYRWFFDGVENSSSTDSTFTFITSKPNTYKVKVIAQQVFTENSLSEKCPEKTTSYNMVVKKLPSPVVKGDVTTCENAMKIPYSVNPSDTADTFTWRVSSNRVNYPFTTSEVNKKLTRYVDYSEPGFDTITVVEDNGVCRDSVQLTVKVAPHSRPAFDHHIPGAGLYVQFTNNSPEPVIVEGTHSEIVPYTRFLWRYGRPGDSLSAQSVDNYTQFFNSNKRNDSLRVRYKYGFFEVTLISHNEYCTDSVKNTIFVDLQENLFVPTALSPSSKSPAVREFLPKGFNLDEYKIWIYDSWGNLLFFSDKLFNNQPCEPWDGTYNGQPLKSDVYTWKIEATFLDGTEWEGQETKNGKPKKFGSVMIIQ
jgi:hypothetical protein